MIDADTLISDPKAPLQFHKVLNPKLWDGYTLRPTIQQKFLAIAEDFLDFMDLQVAYKDLWFTGSLANYNYTKYSDIDLHLLFDYDAIGERKLVDELFKAKKDLWNERRQVTICGFDAEIYAQDAQVELPKGSVGVYSVMQGIWERRPNPKPPTVDDLAVKAKVDELSGEITKLVDGEVDEDALGRFKEKIKRYRGSGLHSGGEFSVENLVFKVLRQRGDIGKLVAARRKLVNQKLSLENIS